VVTASPAAGTTAPETEATAPLPANPGGWLFTDLTRSGDRFSLRCRPDALGFGISTPYSIVVGVDFLYRIQDRLSGSMSTWQYGGAMEPNYAGDFTISFPASRVPPDLRRQKAWFDYQFVGVNDAGDEVGRSAKIVKQITYTLDCTN
jgi:hypothetical protein